MLQAVAFRGEGVVLARHQRGSLQLSTLELQQFAAFGAGRLFGSRIGQRLARPRQAAVAPCHFVERTAQAAARVQHFTMPLDATQRLVFVLTVDPQE